MAQMTDRENDSLASSLRQTFKQNLEEWPTRNWSHGFRSIDEPGTETGPQASGKDDCFHEESVLPSFG
jgi:hypothetical protein